MAKNYKSVKIEESVWRELKVRAAKQDLSLNLTIKDLLFPTWPGVERGMSDYLGVDTVSDNTEMNEEGTVWYAPHAENCKCSLCR